MVMATEGAALRQSFAHVIHLSNLPASTLPQHILQLYAQPTNEDVLAVSTSELQKSCEYFQV